MDWKESLSALKQSGLLPQDDEIDKIKDKAEAEDKIIFPTLKISLDRKQRHGKTATIIEGFDCDQSQVKEIAKYLKIAIGTGGSTRNEEILLQGDWRQKAAQLLMAKGYKVKII